jgi:hypothetical protein
MSSFRILHLSDFHFCIEPNRKNLVILMSNPRSLFVYGLSDGKYKYSLRKPESYDPDIADAVSRFCYQYRGNLDLVLVSGDLATTGLATDLAVAKNFFAPAAEDSYKTEDGHPTIRQFDLTVFPSPGNHDRWKDNKGEPGGTNYDFTFGKISKNSVGSSDSIVLKSEDQKTLGIVFCDNCLKSSAHADKPSPIYRRGQGRVYKERVDDLVSETKRLRKKYRGIGIVWVSHFPVLPDTEKRLALKDRDILSEAAKAENITVIMSGHVHKNCTVPFNGVDNIVADSSMAVDRNCQNVIGIVEIDVNNGSLVSNIIEYKFSVQDAEFVRFDSRAVLNPPSSAPQ